jgi:lantibiotic modifying enzyme
MLPAEYAEEIIAGFSQAWNCVFETPSRRNAFLRIVRGIRSKPRRWIYRATETYAAIIRASIQPSALHSPAARKSMIREECYRPTVRRSVVEAEIAALERLDIPYFLRRTTGWMPPEKGPPPSDLTEAIRKALVLRKSDETRG